MKLEIVEDGEIIGGCEGGPDTPYSWWYRGDSDLVNDALMTAKDLTLPEHDLVEENKEYTEYSSEMKPAPDRDKVLHAESAVTYLPSVDKVNRI